MLTLMNEMVLECTDINEYVWLLMLNGLDIYVFQQ